MLLLYTNYSFYFLDCNSLTYTYNMAPKVVSSLCGVIHLCHLYLIIFTSAYKQAIISLIIKRHSLDLTSPCSQLPPSLSASLTAKLLHRVVYMCCLYFSFIIFLDLIPLRFFAYHFPGTTAVTDTNDLHVAQSKSHFLVYSAFQPCWKVFDQVEPLLLEIRVSFDLTNTFTYLPASLNGHSYLLDL